jgi:hypothetical protein
MPKKNHSSSIGSTLIRRLKSFTTDLEKTADIRKRFTCQTIKVFRSKRNSPMAKRAYVPLPAHQKHLTASERKKLYEARVYRKRREKYVLGYGGKCVCCGESELDFLDVHHVDGDGGAERKQAGRGSNLIRQKIKSGFPPGMEVLCANCHTAIERKGVCPHKSKPT